MNADKRRLNQISGAIIGCSYKVANTLGSGFLEKVYENALAHELEKAGFFVQPQEAVHVFYNGFMVGEYFPDLLVERSVIVELKAVKALDDIHMAQCINYLKATHLKLCLLINFGNPEVEVKRLVHNF